MKLTYAFSRVVITQIVVIIIHNVIASDNHFTYYGKETKI